MVLVHLDVPLMRYALCYSSDYTADSFVIRCFTLHLGQQRGRLKSTVLEEKVVYNYFCGKKFIIHFISADAYVIIYVQLIFC